MRAIACIMRWPTWEALDRNQHMATKSLLRVKNHNRVVKGEPYTSFLILLINFISDHMLWKIDCFHLWLTYMQIYHFYFKIFLFTKILCLNLLLWFLLIHFWSYQVLLESQAYEKCLLRAYSTRLTTFVFTVMVISASTSFLTHRHARTYTPMYTRMHANQENP